MVKNVSIKTSELDLHEIEKENTQMTEVEVRNTVTKLTRILSEFERITDTIHSDTGIAEVINTPPSHQVSTTMRVVRCANRTTNNQTPNSFRNGESPARRRRRTTRESRPRITAGKRKAQKAVDDTIKIFKRSSVQPFNI